MVEALSGETYMKMGKREKVQELLDELQKRAKQRYVSPTALAFLHFLLGENDEGFAWLDRAYEAHDFWLCHLKVEPLFRTDPPDPRYDAMLKKIGLEK